MARLRDRLLQPWRYPERIQERRDLVLRLLMDAGDLTTAEYKAAVESPGDP